MKNHDVIGAGGGGGGKGGGGAATRVPKEDPNTLRSNSKVRLLDLIGEGEIVGLVDGLKSVYIDDTPVISENGDLNFEGLTIHTRNGEPNQDYIPGFSSIESEVSVGTEVKQASPVVRSVQNSVVDAVRIKIRVPALTFQNKENGDLKGSSVSLKIEIQSSGDSYRHARDVVITGKTTSPYERSVRIDLNGSAPWNIRVTRITPDSDTATIRNETFWTSFTEIIDSKLTYPDSALVGIEVDAKQFGSSVPSRSYHVRGRIIKVPSNYDPVSRTYQGFWNGQFKLAYSNNPAWVYYDMATHPRYGANITADKWALYEIGRYCDELVPNGYGDQEPRFTVNTVITDAKDATHALNTLASAFRGMTYWGTSTVMPVADSPSDPVKLVTPANVVEGMFEYAGTGLKARHSAALVTWNDPEDGYRQQVEVVEDPEAIQQFGWKTTELTAFGCTSRGMANRLGRWVLYSERSETETISYTAGTDHADVRPGDIIAVSDPSTAGARLGGRIIEGGIHTLTLDQVPDQVSGASWYIDVALPDGSIVHREVVFNGNQVTLSSGIPQAPIVGAVYILSSQQVEPRLFRVLSVAERSSATYQITGIEHNPNKYAEVELGLKLAERSTSLIPTGSIVPPMDITIETYTYLAGGQEHQAINISWTASDDPRVSRYICEAKGPSDTEYVTVSTDASLSGVILNAESGQWSVRVRSVSVIGQFSPWVVRNTNVAGLLLPLPPSSVDIQASAFSIAIVPFGLTPGALWEFRRSNVALDLGQIESNAVMLGLATQLTDTGLNHSATYFYYIRGVNAYGVSDWYPIQATTSGDVSAILDSLFGKVSKDLFMPELQTQIELIDIQGNQIAQEAIERALAIAAESQARAADISAEAQVRADAIAQEAQERVALAQTLTADIAEEAQARANAIAAEAQARATTIADETLARVDAIRGERDERIAQIDGLQLLLSEYELGLTEEIHIRQEENSYQALQVSLLLAAQNDTAAAVQTLNTVYSSETEALAQNLTVVQAEIEGKASASTIQELTSRVESSESVAISASQAVTALQNSLLDSDGEINLDVIGVFDLNTRVENVEGSLLAQGQAITDLQSQVVDIAGAEAFQLLEARVTQNEDDIESTSVALTMLRNDLPDEIANSLVIQELTSTVIDLDGQVSSIATDLTQLSTQVGQDIAAAVTTLNEAISDESGARASAISQLTAQVGEAQGAIVNEATIRAEENAFTSLILSAQNAAFDNISATVNTTSAINIAENEVIVGEITRIDGVLDQTQASIQNIQQVQLNDREAAAQSTQALTAQFNNALDAKASIKYVNEAVSTETQNRSSALAELSTSFGEQLDTKATKTELSEAISSESEARATAVSILTGQIGDVEGQIIQESQIRASEDDYTSMLLSVQTAAFDNASAAVTTASEINITENGLLLENISSLQGQIGSVQGGLINLQQVQLAETEARVSALQQLDAKFTGDINAVSTSLTQAISNETQARTSAVQQLNASFTSDINAVSTSLTEAISDETSARTSSVNQLTSTLNGQAATLQTQAQTINGLSASFVLKADVGGVLSGYGFAADAGVGSRFTIAADRFAMVTPTINSSSAPANPYPGMVWRRTSDGLVRYRNRVNTAWVSEPDTVPFVIQTSPQAGVPAGVYMDTAFIRDASIDRAKIGALNVQTADIANGAITSAKIGNAQIGIAQIADSIQSTNFSSTQGWRLDKHGQLTANNANIRGHINATSGHFSGTLAANTIVTENIVGGAITQSFSVFTRGNTVSTHPNNSWLTLQEITIPSNISSVDTVEITFGCRVSTSGPTTHTHRFEGIIVETGTDLFQSDERTLDSDHRHILSFTRTASYGWVGGQTIRFRVQRLSGVSNHAYGYRFLGIRLYRK